MTEPTLGDLVEIADVDTVVRLDGRGGRLGELVVTDDVAASLAAVLNAAASDTGAGFFVVGPFGSGKSHFLASVGELLAEPAQSAGLSGWDSGLRALCEAARSSVVVAVPLVEYRAQAGLEDVVAERAWRVLGQPAPDGGADRLASWNRFLAAAHAAGYGGAVVLLDELSEFLRAKQGPQLIEDLRFLQFLGEWARAAPVVVLGALQESIEEVANVSERELARIRDRYEPSLTLSMRHVEDLVRGRLVRVRDGAQRWVEQAFDEMTAAFPDGRVSRERFTRSYPLHPDTLTVLEGLRFVLSQQRGVVDFICRRLRERLERGYADLVTPEEIFDHFRGRLHERAETARFADTVVPYYERAVEELVDADDGQLCLRTVKLLCLLAASPLERSRSAAELAFMLLARVSDLDPAANVAYLEQAILEPLVERGAYVVAERGPPLSYAVELEADASLVAQTRLAQARAEISPGDRRLVATLVELGSSPVLPLGLLAEIGMARREILWQNTLRALVVGTVRVIDVTGDEAVGSVARARSAGAAGCLWIGEIELDDAAAATDRAAALVGSTDRLAVWVPDALRAEERSALVDMHSRRLVLNAARAEGRADLVEIVERGGQADAAVAREMLRRAYFEGQVQYPAEGPGVDLPSLAGLVFERQLARLADPLLCGLHPGHRDVAPRGELVGERLVRQLVNDVIAAGRLGPAAVAGGQLRSLIVGYLVPLGLARLRKDGAVVSPDPARSPAVAEALRLVGDGEPVATIDVVRGLAEGPVGLTESEAILVLNACVQVGLLEAWRGRRRLTDVFLAPTATDRLGAGELVEPAVRAAVAALAPITGPGPFEPWTADVQRGAWEHAKAWLQARREDVGQAHSGLDRFGEVPALAGTHPGPVLDDLSQLGALVDGCSPSLSAIGALRQLTVALTDAPTVLNRARRLGAVARFLRDELRRVEEAAAYLTHPELTIPVEDRALTSRRDAALELVRDSLRLAAEDRSGDLFAANREFRSAYLAAYQDAHDRYYAAVSPVELEELRATPAYRALSRLSAIGAIAVPDDRIRVDRLLAGAAPPPCRRRVDVELAWKPRCACGLALGDNLPRLDRDAVVAVAGRGVRQHLDELARPEIRARLDDGAGDLVALGRAELADDVRRLVSIAAGPGNPDDAAALVTLLDHDVVAVVRDVLSGGQLIVTRDLATLREDLIGRRYPKRRLLELVASWVDPGGDLPPGGFVEVVDSSEHRPADPARIVGGPPLAPGRPGTVATIAERFPSVAALLPSHQAADAFWLAAWWADRPAPPPWLPAGLLQDPGRLVAAAAVAVSDPAALAELADLDARIAADSVTGHQVADALDLAARPFVDVSGVLCGERLLRHPVRLAADQLVRRLAGDWQLIDELGDVAAMTSQHALLTDDEMAPVAHLFDAARHLAIIERRLAGLALPSLVADLYPSHYAPVRELISRTQLACVGGALIGPDTVDAFLASADRLLRAADTEFRAHAGQDFAGSLRIWDVGADVVAPLLARQGRVAVVVIDAMRADLAARVVALVADALPGRPVHRQWAVVPAPTRTAESVAAMRLGRPVPAGSAPGHPDPGDVPFAHLGYEATAVVGADRDHRSGDLEALWTSGPPISVAVATGVDERLHRTSVELAALIDEATAALRRRVVPSLAVIPSAVPLVVLADHGFRENPNWGHGPEGRYLHGGTSLEECVVPVVVFGPADPANPPPPQPTSRPAVEAYRSGTASGAPA